MSRSALHQHVSRLGPMTRDNPEIRRLAKETGFSAEQIYRVVVGARTPSRPCATALVAAVAGKVEVTVEEMLGAASA